MAELKFVLNYDDDPIDCVMKINVCLNQMGYQIISSLREDEDPEDDSVEYKIIPL